MNEKFDHIQNLASIDDLEDEVAASAAILVLLGSSKYFGSANCLRELKAAKDAEKPLVLLHDDDFQKKGAPLEQLRSACPDELRGYTFGSHWQESLRENSSQRTDSASMRSQRTVGADEERRVIPWHRVHEFQMVSLRQIAEEMLMVSPAYNSGPVNLYVTNDQTHRALLFNKKVPLWVSPFNAVSTVAFGLAAHPSLASDS